LIRSDRRIALQKLDTGKWNAQFLRDELGLSGKNALPEIAFPGIGSDAPIGSHH
jgi:hypothetical protein